MLGARVRTRQLPGDQGKKGSKKAIVEDWSREVVDQHCKLMRSAIPQLLQLKLRFYRSARGHILVMRKTPINLGYMYVC